MSSLLHSRRFICAVALLIGCLLVLLCNKEKRNLLSQWVRSLPSKMSSFFRTKDIWYCTGVFILGAISSGLYIAYSKSGSGESSVYQGLWFGLTSAAFYALFRVGMGAGISLALSLLLVSSPLQLYMLALSFDRDYRRYPFVVAVLFFIVCAVRKTKAVSGLVVFSTVLGMLCGVGLTVREDLPLFMLPAAGAILFFTPWLQPRPIQAKLYGLVALAVAFAVTVPYPVLRFRPEHSASGFMTTFDDTLKLSRPAYDTGYLFFDEHVLAVGSSLSRCDSGKCQTSFTQQYLRHFPADFLARIYASVLQFLALPFANQLAPPGITRPALVRFFSFRSIIANSLSGLEVPLMILTLWGLAVSSIPLALLYCALVFFLGGISIGQFTGRFHAYMEFLSWWNFGFLLQYGFGLSKKLFSRPLPNLRLYYGSAVKATIFVFLAGLVLLVPLMLLRMIQTAALEKLFAQYQSAERKSIFNRPTLLNGMHLLFRAPSPGSQQSWLDDARFLEARLGGPNCPVKTLWPVIRYKNPRQPVFSDRIVPPGKPLRLDWSRVVRVDLNADPKGEASMFFLAWKAFEGLELPIEEASCLLGIYEINNASTLPILVNAVIPSGKKMGNLYQKLQGLETTRVHSSLEQATPLHALNKEPISPQEVSYHSPIVKFEQQHWIISGTFSSPPHIYWELNDPGQSKLAQAWYSNMSVSEDGRDLLITQAMWRTRGSALLVKGYLSNGGFTVGLVRNDRSAGSVSITHRGPFEVWLPIQRNGNYKAGIAAKLWTGHSPENRINITELSWVSPATHSSNHENAF
ncbi:MAG: hypothetical protein HY537_12760 [Deltaproteobacteria bacterium]|nr:hypothetical protein [Deltaproteobacteria bacterium]